MKYNEKKRLQIALRRLYTGSAPSKEILQLLGTDKETFIKHIDKFRLPDMSIENFGKVWSLDHIVPVDIFDFENVDEKTLCYNYLNIMPMLLNDNRLKGASIHFSLIKLNQLKNMNKFDDSILNKLNELCQKHHEAVYEKYIVI